MTTTGNNNIAAKEIDQYINSAEDFAKPICEKLREIVHNADPEIKEEWKWGPSFNKAGLICGFGAFKKHVNFFFFKGALLKDIDKIFSEGSNNKNTRGLKLKTIGDINEKVLTRYIKEAIKINEAGIKVPDRQLVIPEDFKFALKKKKLIEPFENMAHTHRKEYIKWIEEAKKLETRLRRIEKAVKMISEGLKFS